MKAIGRNRALGPGLLLVAVWALGCSERQTPVAPVLADATASAGTQATSFSGRATVVQASVLGLAPIVLVDAGPLPAEGGAREAPLRTASDPGWRGGELCPAPRGGRARGSRSEASVAEVSLT